MAFTYSDWMSQSTPELRLERARQHYAELSSINVATSAHGMSIGDVTARLEHLSREIKTLEEQVQGSGAAPNVYVADFREARRL